jgi:hypothetical protein
VDQRFDPNAAYAPISAFLDHDRFTLMEQSSPAPVEEISHFAGAT